MLKHRDVVANRAYNEFQHAMDLIVLLIGTPRNLMGAYGPGAELLKVDKLSDCCGK